MSTKEKWGKLLSDWDNKLKPQWNELLGQAVEYGLEIDTQTNSISRKGCTAEEIDALELRLNTKLPSSYKSFLLVTNGAYLLERPFELLMANKVDWLIQTDPDTVEAWSKDEYDVPDELYYVYDSRQDSVNMRNEYVKCCLTISSEFDTDLFLLNPKIKNAEGEWEAWLLSPKNPGAIRFRSFWDLMIDRLSMVENYFE